MISSRKYLLVLAILFVHVTVLDLFFVTLNGPVFLIDENLQLATIATHALIAVLSVVICFLMQNLRRAYKSGKLKLRDNILMFCSGVLVVAIYLVLFS